MYTAEGYFLHQLFYRFNSSGIQYAVLRNYDNLPDSACGSDVDILVHRDDEGLARVAIGDALRASGGVAIGCTNFVGFTKISALGRTDGEQSPWWGVSIDLFWGMYFAGVVQLLDNNLFARRCRDHNGIRVLQNDLAAVLGIVKDLLHNDKLSPRYISVAAEAVNENWEQIRKDLAPMGEPALVLVKKLCLTSSEAPGVSSESRALRHIVLRIAFLKSPLSYLRLRLLHQWSKVRRFIKPPGMIVVVLGADGVGKSTIISAIEPVLSAATHGAFTVKHLRPGLLPPLARLKRKQADETGPVTDPHGSLASGGIASLLRVLYLMADYVLGYWLVVRPKIARQPAIILFDRYAYDMILDPCRFRIALPIRVIRWFAILAPKPDLIFCLYGDPVVIASRKKELPLDEVTRQVRALEKFAASEWSAILVSTEGTVGEARDRVLQEIVSYCENRSQFSFRVMQDDAFD